MKKILSYFLMGVLLLPVIVQAKGGLERFSQLKSAGLLVLNTNGSPRVSRRSEKLFIPASTTKLVTAWLALTRWGENYRFKTNFYWEPKTHTLTVQGSGDPFLVSEEIQNIAYQLKQRGIREVDTLVLDNSFFQSDLIMPGTGKTNNPYDAVPSALAANFNTIYLKKVRGKIRSAEPQTPLTNYALKMAKRFKKGTLRVNTGRNPRNAELYFAEILSAIMDLKNIKIVAGKIPNQPPFYVHSNSKNLGEMVRPMLKYSTNFIANQLILKLSAEHYQRPANRADVASYMQEKLSQKFGWRNFTLKDGAGLSRANRLSPQQLIDVLASFKRWKHLLPEIEPYVFAKSGTLNKVSTLAGYIENKGKLEPFALMMNQSVPYKLRNQIARELAKR
ncbi:MAG: D-alanyl-D-alanine carboxypeptidase [Cocleimonas sp.]